MSRKRKIYITVGIVLPVLFLLYMFRYDFYAWYRLRNCIVWSPDVEIHARDFEAQPDYNSPKGMSFYTGISLTSNGFRQAHAVAVFDKSKSWTKDTTQFDYQLYLALGKLSFDLTEVYTRRVNRMIDESEYGRRNGLHWNDLEDKASVIGNEYLSQKDKMLYDDSRTKEEILAYWRPKVDSMLGKTTP